MVVAALLGGTASEMTGGKFANGAVTAALAAAITAGVDGLKDSGSAPAGVSPNEISVDESLRDNISFSGEGNNVEITLSVDIAPESPDDIRATKYYVKRLNGYEDSASLGDKTYTLKIKANYVSDPANSDFQINGRASTNQLRGGSYVIDSTHGNSKFYLFRRTPVHEILHGFGLKHRGLGTGGLTSYDNRGVRNNRAYDRRSLHFQEGRLLETGYR